MHWTEFAKITAGVINRSQEPNSRHKSIESIYKEMSDLQIVKPIKNFNQTRLVVANEEWVPLCNLTESKMEQRLRDLSFTRQFTDDLLQWLERMNLVGWNATRLTEEDDETGFNGFYWDAIGYSYLWGLYQSNKKGDLLNPPEEKTGSLVVIESVLHRVMKKYDVAGFIARIDVLYGKLKTKSNFRIIPICFVQSIQEDALLLARKKGIMIISISEVFGTKIAQALKKVRDIDPRKIDAEALAGILAAADSSGQDGKFGSLKGYVFNFLIASVFSNQGYSTAKIGQKYKSDDNRCECDIVMPVDDYLIVCETKGYNEGIRIELGETENDPDTVKKFFEKTCKIVETSTGKTVLPIFITSGEFSKEATEYMQEKSNSKK